MRTYKFYFSLVDAHEVQFFWILKIKVTKTNPVSLLRGHMFTNDLIFVTDAVEFSVSVQIRQKKGTQ